MEHDLVVVATFGYRHEAEMARATLESAGIESVVLADDAGGAEIGMAFANGARVVVRSDDVARARAVLEAE
jgi:Putative prokaryotic signal transducing protein